MAASNDSSCELSLTPQIDRRINFAMQQNDVPVVKVIQIENRSQQPIGNLLLRVTAEPAFADPWEARIDQIGPSATYKIDAVDLQLSPRYLSEITERVRGRLRFELLRGEESVLDLAGPIEVLARDEWSGLSSLPEILAAFVMPNHPGIDAVLRSAADILAAWTGDPSLSGYQTKDPKRVYTMVAAIYTALQRLDLTYINPPASFEDEGQRIRIPDQILSARMATCLDIAVLACGCLEQAGLFPLVMITDGHAFSGVWLKEECFPEPAVGEPLLVRKRVDLRSLSTTLRQLG